MFHRTLNVPRQWLSAVNAPFDIGITFAAFECVRLIGEADIAIERVCNEAQPLPVRDEGDAVCARPHGPDRGEELHLFLVRSPKFNFFLFHTTVEIECLAMQQHCDLHSH